jgi:hypothetical protein
MKSIVTSTFMRGSDASLSITARRVVNNVKNDKRFSSLANSITTVEKALNEYDPALSNAGGGERALIAIKNNKRAVLRGLLGDLAISVQQLSKGDESMILSSGFDLNKDRDSPGQKLIVLTVDLGLPGEATTHIPRVRGSRAYIHQYTTDPLTPDSVWRSETSKSSRYNFKGLPSGAKLWFRVVIFDKDGNSTYLAPVARIIQ